MVVVAYLAFLAFLVVVVEEPLAYLMPLEVTVAFPCLGLVGLAYLVVLMVHPCSSDVGFHAYLDRDVVLDYIFVVVFEVWCFSHFD